MDETQLIQDLDEIAYQTGQPLILEGRLYDVTALRLRSSKIIGQGWGKTIIRGTTIEDTVITLLGNQNTLPDGAQINGFQVMSDLRVISSIPSSQRLGAGVKVLGQPNTHLIRVFSDGHKYGFWNQGGGNEFEHCFAVYNSSHGFYFDGSINRQNEIGVYYCQSNRNGGDGFYFGEIGVGLFLIRPTAAHNSGNGITGHGEIVDTYIQMPEMSTNSKRGIDFGENNLGTGLTITGGLVECSGHENIMLGTGFSNASISGVSINQSNRAGGLILGGRSASVSGCSFDGNKACAIRIGNLSSLTSISACTGLNGNSLQTAGLFFDSGSGSATISAVDFTTSQNIVYGAIANGTIFRGVKGVPDRG